MIRESLADLKKQNKLVRIAEKSIAGWDAANEYGSDSVASDSEDEKRIRRAEQRALSKRKYSMETKTVSRGMQLGFSSGSSVSGSRNRACNSGQLFLGNGNLRQLRQPGYCFASGLAGHWRKDCPYVWNFTQRTRQRSEAFKQPIQSTPMSKNLYESKPFEETTNN